MSEVSMSATTTTTSSSSSVPGGRAARQVGQQAEGGVALGAVPASDACPARGLARVGAVSCQRTPPVRVVRAVLAPCITLRPGNNVLLDRAPRWVSKLHRPWPGGGPPARANSSLSKGCRDYDRDRSGAKQFGFTAAASSPATCDSRIAPSFQEIRHRNSPVRNRPDPTSESDKQHPAPGAAQELQNKTAPEMAGEDSCRGLMSFPRH